VLASSDADSDVGSRKPRFCRLVFILGHYRSGTTHLHNLLALDPRFAAPTFF
jgi:hypothetical protein